MRAVQLFVAGFLLASAMFVTTMIVTPPVSKAADVPLELAGP